MRKLKLTCLSCFFFIWSCSPKGDPGKVAENFLNAIYSRDFAEARKYATEEMNYYIDIIESFQPEEPDPQKLNFKITESKISRDEAIVTYTISSDNHEHKLKMVQRNNVWLVQTSESYNF